MADRDSVALLGSIYAVYLAAAASPGPNTFVVTRLALAEGRRPAELAVLGIALGDRSWLPLMIAGVHLLLTGVLLAVAVRLVAGPSS